MLLDCHISHILTNTRKLTRLLCILIFFMFNFHRCWESSQYKHFLCLLSKYRNEIITWRRRLFHLNFHELLKIWGLICISQLHLGKKCFLSSTFSLMNWTSKNNLIIDFFVFLDAWLNNTNLPKKSV